VEIDFVTSVEGAGISHLERAIILLMNSIGRTNNKILSGKRIYINSDLYIFAYYTIREEPFAKFYSRRVRHYKNKV